MNENRNYIQLRALGNYKIPEKIFYLYYTPIMKKRTTFDMIFNIIPKHVMLNSFK